MLTQLLFIIGASWVGTAARLGRSQLFFWLLAMVLFYLPQAAVVIWLSRRLPLEGGLYQWAKLGLSETWGFLTAWNLWVFTLVLVAASALSVAETLVYALGPRAAWMLSSKTFDLTVGCGLLVGMVIVSAVGLRVGKWVHNFGGATQVLAFAALIVAPLVAHLRGVPSDYRPLAVTAPALTLFNLNVLSKLGMGALSGFEWVAILAGESRDPGRTIARSVLVATPIIAGMFILGTSAVLATVQGDRIDLISPIPQTISIAYGTTGILGAIAPVLVLLFFWRLVANTNLLFTGNTRLPMVAGWDGLLPAWFTRLHPRWHTPLNSIFFVAGVALVLLLLGLTGVGQQEAFQMLDNAAGVFYALAYLVMFALPLAMAARLRERVPLWLRICALSGFAMTLLYVVLSIVPIVSVVSVWAFAAKIVVTIVSANVVGLVILAASRRRASA